MEESKKRKRVSRDVWQQRLVAWRESGLSAEEYARQHDWNASTLKFWSYKLARGDVPGSAATASTSTSSPTVSKMVEAPSGFVRLESAASAARVELHTPGGHRLSVFGAVDGNQLREVLAVVREVER